MSSVLHKITISIILAQREGFVLRNKVTSILGCHASDEAPSTDRGFAQWHCVQTLFVNPESRALAQREGFEPSKAFDLIAFRERHVRPL